MRVFHGSIIEVSQPLVLVGRKNLDFGQGFYVTDIQDQAERWAKRMATRKQTQAILSIYDFESDKAYDIGNCLKFGFYDKTWLDFIAASRKGREPWKGYDIIEGGVANDAVIDTVEDYINGRMSAEAALYELSKHQPNKQICFLSQDIVNEYLHFVESIKL